MKNFSAKKFSSFQNFENILLKQKNVKRAIRIPNSSKFSAFEASAHENVIDGACNASFSHLIDNMKEKNIFFNP